MNNQTADRGLKIVELDFEQRQRAEKLVDAVIDDPSMAAYELIWLRSQLERLTGPASAIHPDGETFESLVEKRLKEAREIYGISAQHAMDFIQRLADILEAQHAQTRAGIRNATPDEGLPLPEPLIPGELEQLRRIDKAARAFIDAPPGAKSGKAYVALSNALFTALED